jgi:threonylcarbamoyladenosine tRNA methylthiotransferase MtaB
MLEIEHAVTNNVRKYRSELLHEISTCKTEMFYETQAGKKRQVLWESHHKDGKMTGFTNNYIRVERPYDKTLVNTIQTVSLGSWNEEKTALVCD